MAESGAESTDEAAVVERVLEPPGPSHAMPPEVAVANWLAQNKFAAFAEGDEAGDAVEATADVAEEAHKRQQAVDLREDIAKLDIMFEEFRMRGSSAQGTTSDMQNMALVMLTQLEAEGF